MSRASVSPDIRPDCTVLGNDDRVLCCPSCGMDAAPVATASLYPDDRPDDHTIVDEFACTSRVCGMSFWV